MCQADLHSSLGCLHKVSLVWRLKSKKKSEGTTAEVIDIMKPGSDENIELGEPVPVVELDKIDLIGRLKNIPLSDTLGLIFPAYRPDEETRATAEVLKTLQKQLPTGHLWISNLSTLPGEAEYFKGGGLMRIICELMKRQMCSSSVSQLLTPVTPAGLILTITVGILPLARVLAEDFMKATLKEGSPNLCKVALKYICRKATSESTSSCSAGHQSGSKDNTASSLRLGASATHSSTPDSSGGTAGSSQGPNEPK